VTGPVDTDDLVAGCVRWLSGLPDVLAVLGTTPDGTAPLLFQNELFRGDIEGSQTTAAVITHTGGWGGANEHNTMAFPRLTLELFVDPMRDPGGNATRPGETYRRINAAYKVFDRRLHRPQGGTQYWGSVRTTDCVRLAEPTIVGVADGDGLLRLQVSYGVTEA
jgi:hypothetical protein